jgi:ABC-type Zn uptake system ZnuABC Zn-binding protein ZnuA
LTDRRRPAILLVVLGLTAAPAISACGDDDSAGESSAGGPVVVASTTQVADLARNVAGDRAEVVGILAPNSDPHDYEPRPTDAEAVAEAGLVLQSGGDLDLWLDELVEASGSEAPIVTLIDSVQTIEGEHAEGVDPHWWQSPVNAIAAVGEIRDRLIAVDPEGRDEYEANADAYAAELERLDRAIAECMDRVPAEQRRLVTSHDALGYFADRYGIEVVGSTIPALTTQAQPSAGETADLVELIEDEGVAAVFPEVGLSTALEQAVADETGATVGAELYADTLGPEGSAAATYIGAMEVNAVALTDGFSGGALECEIDP